MCSGSGLSGAAGSQGGLHRGLHPSPLGGDHADGTFLGCGILCLCFEIGLLARGWRVQEEKGSSGPEGPGLPPADPPTC